MCFVRLVLATLALLFTLPPIGSRAQEPKSPEATETEPSGYRALIAAALSEYEVGHYEESQALMLRAHALFPNARTLRGLGMVQFELREYADSVRYLEQALASELRPLEGALREQTQALLERARSFTAQVSVEVIPRHAELRVDGLPAQANTPFLLNVGDHVVEAQAEQHLPERRSLRVVGGEAQRVQLVLQSLLATQPERGSARAARRAWYKSPWLWVSIGVAVAASAASATTLALTRDDNPRTPPYRGLSGEPPLTGPSQ